MASLLKYVLVRWTTGEYAGTMTPDIDIDWVRGSQTMSFNGEGKPVDGAGTVVIEWRVGKLDKSNGWPLHRAVILQASSMY